MQTSNAITPANLLSQSPDTISRITKHLQDVQSLANSLMAEHGCIAAGWKFEWNSRERALGLCSYRNKTIYLSNIYAMNNSMEECKETILHEISHQIAGGLAGHGPLWKKVCRHIGCKPNRLADSSVVMPVREKRVNWIATCCMTHTMGRKPSRSLICKYCRSKLNFVSAK